MKETVALHGAVLDEANGCVSIAGTSSISQLIIVKLDALKKKAKQR